MKDYKGTSDQHKRNVNFALPLIIKHLSALYEMGIKPRFYEHCANTYINDVCFTSIKINGKIYIFTDSNVFTEADFAKIANQEAQKEKIKRGVTL